jgi:hypothetical protein
MGDENSGNLGGHPQTPGSILLHLIRGFYLGTVLASGLPDLSSTGLR